MQRCRNQIYNGGGGGTGSFISMIVTRRLLKAVDWGLLGLDKWLDLD